MIAVLFLLWLLVMPLVLWAMALDESGLSWPRRLLVVVFWPVVLATAIVTHRPGPYDTRPPWYP